MLTNRNRLSLLSSLSLAGLLVACSGGSVVTDELESSSNPSAVAESESSDLDSTVDVESSDGGTEVEDDQEAEEVDEGDGWTEYVSFSLVEFSVSNAECSYSDGSVEIRATMTNNSDKAIVAFEAFASINDVFGERINGYNISTDETVPPGETAQLGSWGNSCYSLNRFSSDDQRLLEIDDLEAKTEVELVASRLAFEDGEVVEF